MIDLNFRSNECELFILQFGRLWDVVRIVEKKDYDLFINTVTYVNAMVYTVGWFIPIRLPF